ncbi:MAG: hypothetical protein H6Q94_943 [Nitrospirae bacterium]|jgi:hypothetical protein|nr:hypothetical protein [Nitrospirota bacterium]
MKGKESESKLNFQRIYKQQPYAGLRDLMAIFMKLDYNTHKALMRNKFGSFVKKLRSL